MKDQIVNRSPWETTGLPEQKTTAAVTQTRDRNCSMDRPDATEPDLKKLIRLYQNGDTQATLVLTDFFRPLLEKEAARLMGQTYIQSHEDAKSQAILHFLEFLETFRSWDMDSKKVPGLAKKYLHDLRLDAADRAKRHCPDCYTVNFEKELVENTPFSQQFPCYEMETDDQLDARFRSRVLTESMNILTPKERYVIQNLFTENKSPSRIAGEMQCSTRYLRRLKLNALNRMRQYLETHYPLLKAL